MAHNVKYKKNGLGFTFDSMLIQCRLNVVCASGKTQVVHEGNESDGVIFKR